MEVVDAGFKMTEVGIIPNEWQVLELGKIVKFTNGIAHEKLISDNGDYIVVNSKFISTEGSVIKSCDELINPAFKGDILMVMSDVPNGRAIAKCYFVEQDNLYSVNQRICRLTTISSNSKFLFYQLDRNPYYIQFDDGVKQTNLRKSEVLSCPICVPPTLTEQKAIATALSDVDALISQLDQLIEKKQAIKQGAMQELLTPPDQGGKRLEGFSGEWEEKTLGDICNITKGQIITEKTRIEGNVPVIAGGFKPAYYHSTPNRYGKTITISASGANAGYVAYFDFPIYASDCSTIEESPNYDLKFIYYFLKLNQIAIYNNQTGGAQPHIHAKDINPMILECPPLKEQSAIALVLSDMDTEIKELQNKQDKYKQIKQGMMQELLTGKTRLV